MNACRNPLLAYVVEYAVAGKTIVERAIVRLDGGESANARLQQIKSHKRDIGAEIVWAGGGSFRSLQEAVESLASIDPHVPRGECLLD